MLYNLLIYIYIYDVSILKCVCNHIAHFYTYIYVYFTLKYYGVFKWFFFNTSVDRTDIYFAHTYVNGSIF
jgi:hypothetical protein